MCVSNPTCIAAPLGLQLSAQLKNLVEDVRAEALGPIKTGLEIFELSVIPFLLCTQL